MTTAIRNRRVAKSFTLEPETLRYISSTRKRQSASQRLNELLQLAIRTEQEQQLEKEAGEFFASFTAAELQEDRKEARAWQKASRRAVARD